MMVPTAIQLTDLSTKWGLVTFMNPDGTIADQQEITGEEADAVVHGNNPPPNCTRELWETGRVLVYTRPCMPGQAVANPDGTLIVNYGKRKVGNSIQVDLMMLQPHEWALLEGIIMMDPMVALQVDVIPKG